MLTLHVNREVLDRRLAELKLNSRQLSESLRVRRTPTARTLTTWLGGGSIAPRWQPAVMLKFEISEKIYDAQGVFIAGTLEKYKMTRETLATVTIEETISPAAISEWRAGGGIEPDMLYALARYLKLTPISLLSSETRKTLDRIITGDTNP